MSFDRLVTIITGDRPPRVWSLLVTVFGDLAQAPEARISGALLGQMAGAMGIRPEATRVALHRLRKDGWIASQRRGRSSTYHLTDWGRSQSVAASPRIYGAEAPAQTAWLVLVDPGTDPTALPAGVWVTSSTLIAAEPAPPGLNAFSTRVDGPLPDWARSRICPATLLDGSNDLADRLCRLAAALPADVSPLSSAVLRVLVVHAWRRVILKAPALPDDTFPGAWRGPECRAQVAALLGRLPRPALADLDAAPAAP